MARTAVTPMGFARAMVLAYQQADKDPAQALRQARITPSELRDPDARMTAAQMEALSAAAMHELDDEALGWYRRRLPWGSHGMLVRASISAPTLGLALSRWCRHHGLLVDDVRLVFAREGPLARVTIDERRALGAFREICLVTLLRQVHGVSCWWIDARSGERASYGELLAAIRRRAAAHAPIFRPVSDRDALEAIATTLAGEAEQTLLDAYRSGRMHRQQAETEAHQ